jgi:hypothetical protein
VVVSRKIITSGLIYHIHGEASAVEPDAARARSSDEWAEWNTVLQWIIYRVKHAGPKEVRTRGALQRQGVRYCLRIRVQRDEE